ncbi:MAG TPA: NAD(P)H-hydrate dehydratase [Candidatus Limnocylindrales bacterium]|nr:NAD(P)H-hydrate dehydratase [Candidatus Limnocylindrales bacterium]
MRSVLRPLPPDASKETRGRVLIIGGSHRFPGAPLIAARAAARCGAGVVTVATGRTIVEIVAGHDPNITFFPLAEAQPGVVATGAAAQLTPLIAPAEKIRSILIGPGLAHASGTDDFVIAVVRNAKTATTTIDADGLNALARTEDWTSVLPARTILTPHDGEAARLAGSVVPTGAARVAFAERYATQWGVTLVLKGATTVVTDGKKTYVHDAPNPTLGVGGSGDALGGAVAAFAARGLAALAAAAAAVWIHGRAGALLAGEYGESGALATDIVDALPRAMREILAASRAPVRRAARPATPPPRRTATPPATRAARGARPS